MGACFDHTTPWAFAAEESTLCPALTLARVPILDKRLSPLPTDPFLLRILVSGKLNFVSFAVPLLGATITGFQKKGPG